MSTVEFRTTALDDLLDAFASSNPVPGGGSAAALTAALGVSLLLMVASMAKTRRNTPEEVTDLAAAAARLRPLRDELTSLIAEDSRAYVEVLSAYRLPRATEAEQAIRNDAVQRAMRLATEVPLRTLRLCETAIREAPGITTAGNPNAVTDAVVGSRLLLAAGESAGLNVGVNVPSIADADYQAQAASERDALVASARQFAAQVMDAIDTGR